MRIDKSSSRQHQSSIENQIQQVPFLTDSKNNSSKQSQVALNDRPYQTQSKYNCYDPQFYKTSHNDKFYHSSNPKQGNMRIQTAMNFKLGSQKKNIQILRSQLQSAGNDQKADNKTYKHKFKRFESKDVIQEENQIYSNNSSTKSRNYEIRMPNINSQNSPKKDRNYKQGGNEKVQPKILYNSQANFRFTTGKILNQGHKDQLFQNRQNSQIQSSQENINFNYQDKVVNQEHDNYINNQPIQIGQRQSSIDNKFFEKSKLKPLTSQQTIRIQARSKDKPNKSQQSNNSSNVHDIDSQNVENDQLKIRKRKLMPINEQISAYSTFASYNSSKQQQRSKMSRGYPNEHKIKIQKKNTQHYNQVNPSLQHIRQNSRIQSQQHSNKITNYNSNENIIQQPRALQGQEEKQLLISDNEDKFSKLQEQQDGIRIQINKEKKVLNHLQENHDNQNLLFYNFNAKSNNNDQQIKTRSGYRSVNSAVSQTHSKERESNSKNNNSSAQREELQSRRPDIGFDDGKEFKRSTRKKFTGRSKGQISEFQFLNNQRQTNISQNQVIEDEIEEEESENEDQ